MKLQIINRINRSQSSTSQLPSSPYNQDTQTPQQTYTRNRKSYRDISSKEKMKENQTPGEEKHKIQDFFNNFSKSCVVHYQQTKFQMATRNRKLQPLLTSLKNDEPKSPDIKNGQFSFRKNDSFKKTIKICSYKGNSHQPSYTQEANCYYDNVKRIPRIRKFNSLMDLNQLSQEQRNHSKRKPGFILRKNMSLANYQNECTLGINICNQTTNSQQQAVKRQKIERKGNKLIKPNFSSKERIIYLRKQLNIINQLRRIPAEFKLKLN